MTEISWAERNRSEPWLVSETRTAVAQVPKRLPASNEAKVLPSLNHPDIAQINGAEERSR